MGLFDGIQTLLRCPECGAISSEIAQTKDLDCVMYRYNSLAENWYTDKLGQKFRSGLPVCPQFPLDKSAKVWLDQAEKVEAGATIPPEYSDKLRYVNISVDCPKCGNRFRGKISIKEGKLVEPIYDMEEVV